MVRRTTKSIRHRQLQEGLSSNDAEWSRLDIRSYSPRLILLLVGGHTMIECTLTPDKDEAEQIDWREAHWELFWMVFHGQSRSATFQKLRHLRLSRRQAAKMIQSTEREG